MYIGRELRRLATSVADGTYERRCGAYLLTAHVAEDTPEDIVFTLSEAGSRGWTPMVAGRISETGELSFTFCSALTSEASLEILIACLSLQEVPENVTPLPESSPRLAACNALALELTA
jgi:hypothetical protein